MSASIYENAGSNKVGEKSAGGVFIKISHSEKEAKEDGN